MALYGHALNVKAVVFDLDGTLYQSDRYSRELERAYVSLLSARLSISPGQASRRLAVVKRKEHSLTKSLQRFGIPKLELHRFLDEQLEIENLIQPDPRLPYLVSYLKDRGLKVGLLTNAGRQIAVRIIRHLGLKTESFDIFLTGSEVEPKPSLTPFREAEERLQLQPGEILYVGDRIEAEIEPAKKAGFLTALVTHVHQAGPDGSADFRMDSIYDLPRQLALQTGEQGFVVWITGIPSSGKTTLARMAVDAMRSKAFNVEVLESDGVRKVMFRDPTYTETEKAKVYRALLETALFLSKSGVNVFIAATGQKRSYRERAERMFDEYLEVYTKCPLKVAVQRDSQGLYQKALRGEIRGLPGLDGRFDEPQNPDLELRTDLLSPQESLQKLLKALQQKFRLNLE